MKRKYLQSGSRMRFAVFVSGLIFLLSISSPAQGIRPSTPDLDQRRETGKQIEDNNRILQGMKKDEEVRLTKEERQALVNEAFKRLQILHNEMLSMLKAGSSLNLQRVWESASETQKRAAQLYKNLALPDADKDKKQNKEDKPVVDASLNESLSQLCGLITSFVVNVNKSPNDRKAGGQARLDLASIVELSSKIVVITTPKDVQKN